MQVDVAERRKIEHPLRDDAAVTNHDDGVGLEGGELSTEIVVVLDVLRLGDWQSQLQGAVFNRGGKQFEAAPLGTIRSGDQEINVESSLDQSVKHRYSKTRRAAKDEIEGLGHRVTWQFCNQAI